MEGDFPEKIIGKSPKYTNIFGFSLAYSYLCTRYGTAN